MIVYWNLILWIFSCYIVAVHCKNTPTIFNFMESVHLQKKSQAKFKAFTVFSVAKVRVFKVW